MIVRLVFILLSYFGWTDPCIDAFPVGDAMCALPDLPTENQNDPYFGGESPLPPPPLPE